MLDHCSPLMNPDSEYYCIKQLLFIFNHMNPTTYVREKEKNYWPHFVGNEWEKVKHSLSFVD